MADRFDLVEVSNTASADELRSAIAQREEPMRAKLAFKELVVREGGLSLAETSPILLDQSAPFELRAAAAVEVGRHLPREAEPTLLEALPDAPAALVRHIARSLGQIGGEKARKTLLGLPRPDGPAGEAVDFAVSLISYRLGDTRRLIEPPRVTIPTKPKEGAGALEFRLIGRDEAERRRADVLRAVPADAMDLGNGLKFVCGASEHWILLNEKASRASSMKEVLDRPAILGVLLKYRVCSDRYSLDEYLLGNGSGQQVADVVGVRPSGSVVHAGKLRLRGSMIDFSVDSTVGPLARPIHVQGSFDHDTERLSFSEALVGDVEAGASRSRRPRSRAD